MTILAAEADFYPEDLWRERAPGTPRRPDSLWWCLHTKPRQEKAVARDLRAAGVSFYLPQILNEHHTPRGRAVKSLLPMFTGYIFLYGDDKDRMKAIQGNRLAGVLQVFDQEGLEKDLVRIQKLLSSGLPLVAEPRTLPGTFVRIKEGPLAGLEGKVSRRGNGDHFVAMVRFLSQGASVQLQDWQVEPIAAEIGA